MDEETYNDNESDLFKGEYMEDEDIVVKWEDTTQDNSVHISEKAVTYKRSTEELGTDQPQLKVPSPCFSSSPFTLIFTRSVS